MLRVSLRFAVVFALCLSFVVPLAAAAKQGANPYWEPWMVDPGYPTLGPDGGLPFVRGITLDALTEAEIDQMKSDLAFLMGIEDLLAVPIESRPSLNPVVTGEVQRDGYVIYKLYYESLPGFPVSANLYVPDDDAFPLPRPAVICPHGHWEVMGAKFSPQVQVRSIGLVKLGYTVLAYDALGSGERQRGPIIEGHETLSAAQSWPGGPIPTGMMAYELSRAVDYLLTRPDVADMTVPAVTGASGGASQTVYGTIFDDRIAVAVPVAWGGIAHPHPFGTADENIPLLNQFLNRRNVTTLVYPAKSLYLSETSWATWLVQNALDTYDALGVGDWIEHAWDDAPHDYSQPYRERMYAWMSRWVLGVEAGETIPDPDGVADDMAVEDSSVLTVGLPSDRLYYIDVCAGFRAGMPGVPLPASESEWAARWQSIEDDVAARFAWPTAVPDYQIDPDPPTGNPEVFAIRTEGAIAELWIDNVQYFWESWIGLEFTKPSGDGPWPVVVLVNPEEFPRDDADYEAVYVPIDDSARIAGLVADGYAVLKVTPRFNDDPDFLPTSNLGYWYMTAVTRNSNWNGGPLFGRHVFDLTRIVDYLETRPDVDPARITFWGMGEGGPLVTTTAALDDRVCQCVVDRAPLSFAVDKNDRHPPWAYPPRMLESADIEHLASMIVPRRMVVADAIDDEREALTLAESQSRLGWTIAAYDAFGASSELRILAGEKASDPEIELSPACAADIQTGIDLVSFDAFVSDSNVVLSWETAAERNTAGFYLRRSSDGGSTWTLLTEALVPAEGGPTAGASYEWADENVHAGAYLYVLADIDLNGVATRHGPVAAIVAGDLACGVGGSGGAADGALLAMAAFLALALRRRLGT